MADRNWLVELTDHLTATAGARTVFGEPVHAEGRTVIPVARVAYGFGGGFGEGPPRKDQDSPFGQGGGAGGGLAAKADGVIEILPTGTRFVPAFSWSKSATLVAAGLLAGLILGRLTGRGAGEE